MYQGVIYKISNNVNGKIYIGKTIEEPKKYWEWHKRRAKKGIKKLLYNAIKKYGVENFSFEVIEHHSTEEKCDLNNILTKRERFNIKIFKSKVPSGYNLTDGGEGLLGYKMSEESRGKIRKAKLGVPRPPEVIEKLRGRKLSETHKNKLRKPKTEEHKEKLRGRVVSDETCKKISDSKKGKYVGENNPFYGKKHSDEFVQYITEKNRAYSKDPVNREYNIRMQPTRIGVQMLHPKTGELLHEFLSIKEAVRWIRENTRYKGDDSTISDALKKNRVSYGYLWKRVEDKV